MCMSVDVEELVSGRFPRLSAHARQRPIEGRNDGQRAMAEQDGVTENLVCLFSVLEPGVSLAVAGSRKTQGLEVVRRNRRCLYLYGYLIDPVPHLLRERRGKSRLPGVPDAQRGLEFLALCRSRSWCQLTPDRRFGQCSPSRRGDRGPRSHLPVTEQGRSARRRFQPGHSGERQSLPSTACRGVPP